MALPLLKHSWVFSLAALILGAEDVRGRSDGEKLAAVLEVQKEGVGLVCELLVFLYFLAFDFGPFGLFISLGFL